LLLTVVTGAVQTWRLDRGALFDSSHGRVLLVKALAVGVMVFVGLATRQFVATRLRKADSMTGEMAGRLRRATGMEAAGGVLVLVLTSWLLSFTPAGLVQTGDGIDYAYTDGRFVMEDAGARPHRRAHRRCGSQRHAGRGDVARDRPSPPCRSRSVRPTTRSPPTVVFTMTELTGIGAAVLPEAEGVPLDMAGVWTLEVSVTTATGTQTAQKTFAID
jgi:copper transport protein